MPRPRNTEASQPLPARRLPAPRTSVDEPVCSFCGTPVPMPDDPEKSISTSMRWDNLVRHILVQNVLVHQCAPERDPKTEQLRTDKAGRLIYRAIDLPL